MFGLPGLKILRPQLSCNHQRLLNTDPAREPVRAAVQRLLCAARVTIANEPPANQSLPPARTQQSRMQQVQHSGATRNRIRIHLCTCIQNSQYAAPASGACWIKTHSGMVAYHGPNRSVVPSTLSTEKAY